MIEKLKGLLGFELKNAKVLVSVDLRVATL
jgi:hypothetical protein